MENYNNNLKNSQLIIPSNKIKYNILNFKLADQKNARWYVDATHFTKISSKTNVTVELNNTLIIISKSTANNDIQFSIVHKSNSCGIVTLLNTPGYNIYYRILSSTSSTVIFCGKTLSEEIFILNDYCSEDNTGNVVNFKLDFIDTPNLP